MTKVLKNKKYEARVSFFGLTCQVLLLEEKYIQDKFYEILNTLHNSDFC